MRNRKYDWRRLRRIAAAVLLLAGALSGCAARAGADSPWKFFTGGTDTEPLTAAFLKVGKADAIVLVHAGEAVVIDCGEEEDGAEVVEYLKARNISRISVLIITHFDQDHVGGADTVAEQMEIGRVLLPAYEGSGSEYADLLSALDAKGIEPELLAGPLTFRFGEAEVLVSPPDSYEVPAGVTEFDNNFSLITTVTHGKMRLVFAGDIEKQRIRAYLETGAAQKCDFLKVPHHGVYNTALPELFETLRPEYAVICSSKKHPADVETVEALKRCGARVLETRSGDITVVSDGARLSMRQS